MEKTKVFPDKAQQDRDGQDSMELATKSYHDKTTGMDDAMSEKPHVNIGTIGHIDHSKHTLTEAIKITLSNKDEETSTLDKDPEKSFHKTGKATFRDYPNVHVACGMKPSEFSWKTRNNG